jgi:hypothetical protein
MGQKNQFVYLFLSLVKIKRKFMKVYIIRTPEYDVENYQVVITILKSITGPIEFVKTNIEVATDSGRDIPLSWKDLFGFCNKYRDTFKIDREDFVVLLTDRKNFNNWFSSSDANRNIFVITSEWEKFTTINREFPIIHQIIENLFQVLMGIDVTKESPFIHKILKGCINDFCSDKFEVIAKLKTGAICEDCIIEIRAKFPDIQMAKHLKRYLNLIRSEYDIDFFDLPIANLSSITLRRNWNNHELVFNTYNKILKLDPLEMALYIFYLNYGNEEGINLNNLRDQENINRLVDIYCNISPNLEREDALGTINGMVNKYFSIHKSKIGRKIKQAIQNENISNQYIISGSRGEPFKILISRDLVAINY